MTALKSKLKNDRGFSLIEMVVVVSIVMLLAAFAIPVMTNTVSSIKLRYAAIDFSGLLQKARIEAVRKNAYYTVQQSTMAGGDIKYYVDLAKNQTYTSADPSVELGRVTVYAGTGSGAPHETSFVSSFSFTMNTGSSAIAAFNARGLPCIAGSLTCPEAAGQGFVYFLSRSGSGTNWAAVVITPSGRVQTWSYDNSGSGNWVQQ